MFLVPFQVKVWPGERRRRRKGKRKGKGQGKGKEKERPKSMHGIEDLLNPNPNNFCRLSSQHIHGSPVKIGRAHV